ncbi:MAG: trypsin-like serine protease [Myxococcales bacterium]|nr:trypsin-like serine protease [Myxococcales bacterium]
MRTFGIGCLLIAGCAETGAPPVETPAGTVVQPIYGGLPPDAPEHAAVIGIHQRSGDRVSSSPFCSGTLITPEVVLTAAHCLDNARGGKTFKTATPDSIAIYFGDGVVFDQTPLFYPVVETLIHPGYDRNALRNDLGLIRLAFPMNDIAPVPNLPSALALSNADIGSPLNFAGFGYAEDRSFGVKLQADTPLGGFGCSVAGCSGGSDAATQISYSQQNDGPCNGDSGGPAFAYRGGQAYVAGITSYGDSGCTIYGVSTRVDAFQPVIDDFVNGGGDPPPACGADGVCEAGCADDPDCNGGPGGGACGDGVCGDGESCDGRSGTSACPSDCAGRTGGRPSGRYCYVEGACEGPGCP